MPERNKIRKALIMEDEPVISNVLWRTFKLAGLEVDIAENGRIAREKIDAGNTYDFFIFDIRTPVISGIQFYEYMETNFPDMTQKVIFMTGDYINAVTCAFLDRVKRPFINKPFTPDRIMDLVKHTYKPEVTTV